MTSCAAWPHSRLLTRRPARRSRRQRSCTRPICAWSAATPERPWNGRGHFFAAAAEAMRRILVENARRKRRYRHGGGLDRIDLDRIDLAADQASDDLLALNEAPRHAGGEEPAVAEVVKLRYFAGLSIEEAASVLGVSVRTANRHWAYARAWLFQQLSPLMRRPIEEKSVSVARTASGRRTVLRAATGCGEAGNHGHRSDAA